MEPDTTTKASLFQRPPQHLLTGQTQKMCMPDHQHTISNSSTTRYKRHPLHNPFRKVFHSIHDSSIYFFKITLVCVFLFIRCPVGLCLPIVQTFVKNTVGRREFHCRISQGFYKSSQSQSQSQPQSQSHQTRFTQYINECTDKQQHTTSGWCPSGTTRELFWYPVKFIEEIYSVVIKQNRPTKRCASPECPHPQCKASSPSAQCRPCLSRP